MRDQKRAEELKEEIESELEVFNEQSQKCIDGNASAGARSRKATSALTKLFKEWRNVTV